MGPQTTENPNCFGFSALRGPERCSASKPNREAGSRNFASDDEQNICDRQTKTAPPGGFGLALFFRFLENDALAQDGVEFRDLNLAFHGLLILASPDDVVRLRGLELEQAVL